MTAPFTSMQAPQISERFCSSNADITIVSSDGVYFKVYRKNLEVHSDIFSDADAATLPDDGALVPLSEPAAVLELLFQYMRRQLPPDLQDVDFATCAALAEAAEKYWVYSALSACREKMKCALSHIALGGRCGQTDFFHREAVKEHPLEILEYAVRHGHEDLAAEAARNSVGLDALAAMECLSPDTFKAWVSTLRVPFLRRDTRLTHRPVDRLP
ncbi:hypothetical protein B0H15DRAFT_541327 [Mycena belliarum]|uniref:BTB domain-containing protein n=1 Tax=Mycena belliarum TaxID=1033014 RepID=A0AAD6UF61_9AGAR|nr:hypothetical protein B0H15DRAFT_541327 [Mycena belliae]